MTPTAASTLSDRDALPNGNQAPEPRIDRADTTPLGHLLDLETAEVAPGRYRVAVDEAWTVVHVHGGVVAAIAARMAEHARPREAMRVTGVSALYLRPLTAGPVDGVVSWLRVGRGAAQASVDLSGPDGELAVRVTVVLASAREDGIVAPATPRPQGALDVAGSLTALGPVAPASTATLPFQRQHAWVRATPGDPRDGRSNTGSRTYDTWFRLHETPRTSAGAVEPLISCLAADAIGIAATETLGLWDSERTLVLPTLSMDLQILETPSTPWLLQHAEIHHLADGLVLGTVRLFDEADQLVGFASQRAAVRFF